MLLIAPIYAGITHSRCKFWHYPGEILLIILWMSYFLYPQLARLPAAAKTVSQQKKGQNFSRVISKFTRCPADLCRDDRARPSQQEPARSRGHHWVCLRSRGS